MKKLILILIALVVTGVSLFIFYNWNGDEFSSQVCTINCDKEQKLDDPQLASEESTSIVEERFVKKLSSLDNEVHGNNIPISKDIHSDWCDAQTELNKADYALVQEQEKEWQKYIGKAPAGYDNSIHNGNDFYPDNYNIAPYQELPLDELEQQAFSGDKWAMVAYVQLAGFHEREKAKEIANRLIVRGAFYHGIEYLTVSELASARTNYRREQFDKSAEHMINAIVYTMVGLKNYTESGLIAYLGNISGSKIFQGIMHPAVMLKNRHETIRERYQKLVKLLEREREEQSIFLEEVPEVIKKSFVKYLAAASYGDEKELQFLQNMEVTPEVDLRQSSCLKKMYAKSLR